MKDLAFKTMAAVVDKAPLCAFLVLLLGATGYVYAGRYFATRAELESKVEDLSSQISQGFNLMSARLDLSDADKLVSDLQNQIRLKEREIADLEMVIREIENPNSESANLLKNRIFVARQDAVELQARLNRAVQQQQLATQQLRRAGQ